MIRLYDTSGLPAYPLSDIENFCIIHAYDGLDTLSFDISPKHELYSNIAEEIKLDYDKNIYVIKSVNERTDRSTIDCELDLDLFKQEIKVSYTHTNLMLAEVLDNLLPSDWTAAQTGVTNLRRDLTVEHATNYDVLMQCQELYGVTYQWETKNKHLTVVDPSDQPISGVYLTDELNLQALSFKGDSKKLITRLYAYGKDGLTISSVNGGKEYVDNNTYSSKIVSSVMNDTKHTDPAALRAAAVQNLAQMAVPIRSYQCTVMDLAKLNPDYAQLTFTMYANITLIDRNRKMRINHQVVEYQEYPFEPMRNVVTLSNTIPTLKSTIDSIQNSVKEEIDTTRTDFEQAILNATNLITGHNGGYVVFNPAEKPEEILVMDQPDKTIARKIWRWNKNGLGYSSTGYNGDYSLAITMDGQIVADKITSGTLNANLIRAGKLMSSNGATWIDMQDGTFSFNNGLLRLDGGALIVNGDIYSSFGVIGGWRITHNGLHEKDDYTGICNARDFDVNQGIAFWAGAEDSNIGRANIRIYTNGTIGVIRSSSNSYQIRTAEDKEDIQFSADDNAQLLIEAPMGCSIETNESLRIMNPTADAYMPVKSSSFLMSSREGYKCNIQEFNRSALDIVNSSKIYEYNFKTDTQKKGRSAAPPSHIGFVIERETPQEILDETNNFISLGDMCSVLWKSVQEQQDQIQDLQEKVNLLMNT